MTAHRDAGASRRMSARGIALAAHALFLLTACAVHRPYPASWEPLPVPPTADCHHFEGNYYDRGEIPGRPAAQPSLVAQLFGYRTQRGTVGHVRFVLLQNEVLQVNFWEGMDWRSTPTFTRETNDFTCEAGRLVVHDQHGAVGGGVIGLQDVTITFSATEGHLVAEVKEFAAGLLFILPVAGTATSWYRFRHLRE